MRRAVDARGEAGLLDAAAIERVRDEARPDPRDEDELHDALLTAGFLLPAETAACSDTLMASGRATRVLLSSPVVVAAERLPELLAVHPGAPLDPPISARGGYGPAQRRSSSCCAAG